MNANDIFKGLFGFPRERDRHYRTSDDDIFGDEDEFDLTGDIMDGLGDFNQPFGFHENEQEFGPHSHMHFFTEAQEMFRHFEDIFRNLGLAEFPPIRHEVPSFHPPVWAIPGSDGSEGQAPRDSMLKVPDGPSHDTVRVMPFSFSDKWGSLPGPTKPQLKIDTDIDDKVSEGNLDSILKSSGTVKSPSCSQPRQNQYFRSVKIIRKRGPDGRIEETRTVRDGEGNEETVTTQTLGDGSCSVTTHEDKKGDSDTRDRLSEFGEAWMHPQVAPEIPQRIPIWRPEYLPKMEPLMPSAPLKDQEADTLYSKFFGPKPPLQENHWSSSENSNQSFLKRLLRW